MNQRLEKIKDYSKFLPGFIGLLYIFGFIIINSHLSKFGFNSLSLLDKSFISTGALFVLFIGSVFLNLIYFIKEPTDNIKLSYTADLKYFIFVLLTSIAYTFLFINTEKLSPSFIGSFWVALIFISFISITFKLNSKFVIILVLLVIIFFFVWTLIYSPNSRGLLIGFLVFAVLSLTIYGQISDFGFAYVDLVWWFGSIILSAYLFGSYIYGDVKKELGGGTTTSINLMLQGNVDHFSHKILADSINTGLSKDVDLIYETSDYFFISVDTLFIKIKKDLFDGYVTVNNN